MRLYRASSKALARHRERIIKCQASGAKVLLYVWRLSHALFQEEVSAYRLQSG